MAKNINYVSFTMLLLVLVIASTGIFKSEAIDCVNNSADLCPLRVFYEECGPNPYPGTDADCCNCCKTTWGSPPVCWAVVEGNPKHCHCYKKL
ncbi:defensin-like protein 206 [Eutrema salsugineum]|uniref:defensin-like protein 206 n=1 Tax=Eutrema salsugineum TaxID=72664 RepID=UPI000CED3A0F|nr:defensin-like protein 206 [Eutrema salsugineum]